RRPMAADLWLERTYGGSGERAYATSGVGFAAREPGDRSADRLGAGEAQVARRGTDEFCRRGVDRIARRKRGILRRAVARGGGLFEQVIDEVHVRARKAVFDVVKGNAAGGRHDRVVDRPCLAGTPQHDAVVEVIGL